MVWLWRTVKWLFLVGTALVMLAACAPLLIPVPDDLALGAPDPAAHPEPIVQVWGADVWGVRGLVAIHTWVAVKPRNADRWTNYQVIGWRLRRTGTALVVDNGNPDRPWFGSPAHLLLDRRGPEADALVAEVQAAVASYPFAGEYRMWPGPNSNSFTSWVGLEVPELQLDLPFKALGDGWMRLNHSRYASADN